MPDVPSAEMSAEVSAPVLAAEPTGALGLDPGAVPPDTLALPRLDRRGHVPVGIYPMGWGGWHDWGLHGGLNLSVGLSAFVSFGKGPWKGVGFGQNISAMYAIPVTDRLSVAVGGYLDHLFWQRDSYVDAGLSAVIGYRFDEHWEAYLYGQKSLVRNRMPMPLYDVGDIGDRIGATVKYNFSPTFSIQVSVETGTR